VGCVDKSSDGASEGSGVGVLGGMRSETRSPVCFSRSFSALGVVCSTDGSAGISGAGSTQGYTTGSLASCDRAMRRRCRGALGGKASPSHDNHGVYTVSLKAYIGALTLTGGKKRSDSGIDSVDGLCTRWGAGEADCESISLRVLTVDVLSGGDGGVWTGAADVVDAELGGGNEAAPIGV